MPDIDSMSLLAVLTLFLKGAALTVGFLLAVRLLAGGGRTADDRDRALLDAVRRPDRRARSEGSDPALPVG